MLALGTVALGGFVLAAFGSLWLARTLTDPIKRVAGDIATMTAARDFGRTLEVAGTSRELDALATAFNELMGGLTAAEAETQSAYLGAIRALAAALDARDPYTAGHSERVSALSVLIARQLALSEAEVDIIRLGALLHDIGKIGVADHILRKPGPLSADEFEQIRRHPGLGARILRKVPFLEPHLAIVELHHERPDGKGYPFGLLGDNIPLDARIVHVADAFDAMTSARAYRPARAAAVALVELQRYSGSQFDPASVDALRDALAQSSSAPERQLQALLGPGSIGVSGGQCAPSQAYFSTSSSFPLAYLCQRAKPPASWPDPSPFALDTAASFDQTRTFNGDNSIGRRSSTRSMSVGFGAGFEGMIRPWAQRQASGEWNKQIWIAAVRYQRPGPIGLRVDAGLIPSPIGLSNLMLRPQLNPTVSLPASLFQPLPPMEVGGPRATLLGAVYAYGANATVSGARLGCARRASSTRRRCARGGSSPARIRPASTTSSSAAASRRSSVCASAHR